MKGKTSLMWRVLIVLVLVLTLGLVTAVPVAAADTWYVDDSAEADGDGTTAALTGANCAFDTIQEGINAASNGDTVTVAAGTYDENLSLTKEITLGGAAAATTIIQGTIEVGNAGAGTTVIEEFTIDTDTGAETMGVNFSTASSVTIQDCIFEYDDGDNAIRANADSTLATIAIGTSDHGNTFTDKSSSLRANAISIDGDLGGVEFTDLDISYNTFTMTATGWGIIIEAANGVGNSSNLTITNNTFSTDGFLAIILLDNDAGGSGIASDITIANNNFATAGYAGYGIYLYNETNLIDHLPATIDVGTGGLNTFNTTKSVKGAACIGATASATTLYPAIQDAITAASNGNEINVYPGTYAEVNVAVNKELTITGVDHAGDDNWTEETAGAGATAPTISNAGAGHLLISTADNTTIQGFNINTSGDPSRGVDIGAAATQDDFTIQYCTFTADAGDRSLSIDDIDREATDFTITYCDFTNNTGATNWFTIGEGGMCSGANTISYNTIDGAVSQLRIHGDDADIYDITYSYNTFSNAADGILLQETSEGTSEFGDIVIQGNTFAGGGVGDYGVLILGVEDADFEGGNYTAENVKVNYNSFGTMAAGSYATVGCPDYAVDLNAQYNYWGAALDGPTQATNNVNGTGADCSLFVDFSPWLYYTLAADDGDTVANVLTNEVPAYAQSIDLIAGWNTFSVPIGLDGQYNTCEEIMDLTGLTYDLAYRFNSATQTFVSLGTDSTYAFAPGEGFYIHMTAADSIPYCYSTEFSMPSRDLEEDWNFIGGGLTTRDEDDSCISIITAGNTAGYSHIVSPAENAAGAWVFIAGADHAESFVTGEGYWVFLAQDRTLGLFDPTPVAWDD